MAYEIEIYPDAREQIHALPAGALPALAEVMAMLELTPWNGSPLNEVNPDGAVRVVTFGPRGEGLATYLVLDGQQRVDVLRVIWIGP